MIATVGSASELAAARIALTAWSICSRSSIFSIFDFAQSTPLRVAKREHAGQAEAEEKHDLKRYERELAVVRRYDDCHNEVACERDLDCDAGSDLRAVVPALQPAVGACHNVVFRRPLERALAVEERLHHPARVGHRKAHR